jgi:hypothetical protein
MDRRFPGYLRVRVEFPLAKALMPSLTVRIKGRGATVITLRYENVAHFCFWCGKIGHALATCEDEEADDDFVQFGEELRVSPTRRVREITLKQVAPRVIKPLFKALARRLRPQLGGGIDRNKSLYLVFVGVIFLSIFDCF